jgi:DNA-binding XRE family transcriptional regulator
MRRSKQTRLERKGWRVGSAAEFLDLTPEEVAYVEMKLKLGSDLRRRRRRGRMTQVELARMTGSSQSRIAKMESGDPSVSLDLLFRSLLVLGATRKELARVISA